MSRVLRDARGVLTTIVLTTTSPRADRVAIATLNADEENATVIAVQLAQREPGVSIDFLSPDPDLARRAVAEAARCLDAPVPSRISYAQDRYTNLLRAFTVSARTFTTHVVLPGVDRSGRRVHTHLTHGSGPKPDTTFRGPTTVLASITDAWVPAQLREYRLPPTTRVVREMPRLEVMRRAAGDRTVLARMGLDSDHPVVVWAPTYRAIERAGGEIRVSGTRFTAGHPAAAEHPHSHPAGAERVAGSTPLRTIDDLRATAETNGWTCIAKPHPRDADDLRGLGLPVFTNDDLRRCGVTAYELFGAADLLITDYSSVFTERAELGLPFALWCPDLDEFASSYRGLREPLFTAMYGPARSHTTRSILNEVLSVSARSSLNSEDFSRRSPPSGFPATSEHATRYTRSTTHWPGRVTLDKQAAQ
ncbi:CDP-glycerol glycerophosphotransferase family protein [Leucobacter triazinivorans]|nr:CDP-glycerol glycerophosphotransferase family protein [Leucobacter triazinivorans]